LASPPLRWRAGERVAGAELNSNQRDNDSKPAAKQKLAAGFCVCAICDDMVSRIPAGMRYYIGAEARLRRTIEDAAMSVFESWSYEEVITPSVDY
jgi:hypothetical protein